MNRISELRKKLGLTQTRLGEEIGVSQQTISKYEKVDENISGDMLLALSKFFKVPVDYILRKDEEEQQREQDNKREIMELYRDMDQYNRDTWIIIGKRLLGGQLHKYNEDSMGIKQCVLLVHSISGVYGLNFVQNYPEKVKGFIAVDNTVYDEELAEAMEVEKKYMLQGIDEFQKIKNSFSSLEEFQTALKADPEKYGAALPQVSGYTYTETDREEYIQAYSLSSNDTIRNEVNGMDQSLLSIKNKKFPSALPVLTMISSENVQNVPAWETAHRNQLDLESGNHQLYIVNGGHYIWYTNLTQVVQLINEWRMENHF